MQLVSHPRHPPRAVSGVAVQCERDGDALRLRFAVAGEADLRWVEGRGRTDELWRRTCFEAFVTGVGPEYREFNFAPSGAWAAYGFDGYRSGVRDVDAAPSLAWDGAILTAGVVVDLPGDWRVNLTAVIEEADGTKSYWALAHSDGPPDFHDPACFVLELPAAD